MARTYKRRKKWSVGARYGRFGLTASHTSEQTYRDGEDATNLVAINAGQTNSLLLGSFGDFVVGDTTGWAKSKPKIRGINMRGHFGPTDDIDTADQNSRMTFLCWLMACPLTVSTDFVTNSRDPNDATLAETGSAHPHSIFRVWMVHLQTSASARLLAWPGKFNQVVNFPRPYVLKYPFNLYFMCKPIYEAGFDSGVPATDEWNFTWHVNIRANNALQS